MSPRRLLPAVLTLMALAACQDDAPDPDAIAVPSGRTISLIEVITNVPGPEGATARFRFLAPGLGPDDAEAAQDDMQALCDAYALPRIGETVPTPQQIIISLSAEAVPFGEAAPGVVQFFESYSPQDDGCIWEPF
jgi:hypothetical protein